MKIAIIGAGISGLSAAAALQRPGRTDVDAAGRYRHRAG
ncbi:MAG: NAD(P)-binding protein [Henriciella sp.]